MVRNGHSEFFDCFEIRLGCGGACEISKRYEKIITKGGGAIYWNGFVFILMKFQPLAALEMVIVTTSGAACDDNFVKMTTFPFTWQLLNLMESHWDSFKDSWLIRSSISPVHSEERSLLQALIQQTLWPFRKLFKRVLFLEYECQ